MGKKKIIFSKASIIIAAKEYIKESYITMEYVARNYGVSQPILSRNLFFAIADGTLPDELAYAVSEKVINAYKDQIALRRNKWNKAFELRQIHLELESYKTDFPYLVDEVKRIQGLLAWPDEDEKERLENELYEAETKLSNAMNWVSNLIKARKQIISTLSFSKP